MRVFLDTNIIFSAAQARSATRELLEAIHRYGEALTNRHAWTEAQRNLARKRPTSEPGLEELLKIVRLSNAFQPMKGIDLPQEDIPILAGAIGSRCTHLCGRQETFRKVVWNISGDGLDRFEHDACRYRHGAGVGAVGGV